MSAAQHFEQLCVAAQTSPKEVGDAILSFRNAPDALDTARDVLGEPIRGQLSKMGQTLWTIQISPLFPLHNLRPVT